MSIYISMSVYSIELRMYVDKNYRTYEEFTEYPKSKYYNPVSEWNKSTHKIRFTKVTKIRLVWYCN